MELRTRPPADVRVVGFGHDGTHAIGHYGTVLSTAGRNPQAITSVYAQSSGKDLKKRNGKELNSAGVSEEEDGSIRKSKITKYASSASAHVTEVVWDTEQIQRYDTRKQGKELYNSGESDGENATVPRVKRQEPSTLFTTASNQELKSAGESEDEDGLIMKSLKSKNESFASVPVTKQIRRYGTRKQIILSTGQYSGTCNDQTQKVDEPRSTDLTSLRDSDGMDSTSSLEYAATSNVIDQELLASLKRQQENEKCLVKVSEKKQKTELNSAGESEESDEDTSIRKSKIPKYAPSESVTELKLDTKQELHHAGESEEEDDSIRKSKIPKYDISNKRIKPLPSRTTIEKMWSIKGESEQSFHYYCHDICTFIKNKSDSILNVWPAYATDEANGMCFIVQTQEKLPELSDVDYPVYVRPMSQYSNENKIAMQRKEARDNMLEFKDVKHIQEVIDRHTSELFRCHSQLSVISGSGFRSKGYDEHDNSNHQIIPGNTVVMYVKIKGKVPLLEKLLPTELDGIPVDVREGGFESASLNATDCLPNLRMGCQIASAVGAGTLGGFIHHPMYGLCGTTCAHVVLSDAELKSSVTKNYGKRTWEEDEKIIRQPANRGRKVGRVTETFFKACEEGSCGIDLAVFQIEERPPNSGKFPTVKGVEIDMIYESGKMCEKSPFLHGRKVRKFGSATEFTEGVVNFPGAVCRLTHGNKEQTQLFMKVIDICSLDGPDFCLRGDSGALVFQTGVGRDSVCVGMLIGEVNGNGIALPISEVKEKLGVSEFEPFRL